MPEKGTRSPYSQCPIKIITHDDHGMISSGTAFFYSYGDEWFLVTNWHNVSGRHFITKEPLTTSRHPTYITAMISKYEDGGTYFRLVPLRVEIYANYTPLWFEHPTMGSGCDVVAFPISRPEDTPEFMHNAVNLICKMRIPVKPGNTVFIIGFPRSLSVGYGLPLWKSGYIASEPHYDVTVGGKLSPNGNMIEGKVLPAFFIDSQTREGMSGAPVFAAYHGTWDKVNPYIAIDPDDPKFWESDTIVLGHHSMEFVGCYSGRVGKNEEGAALGLCWKVDVIALICRSKKLGSHPHLF